MQALRMDRRRAAAMLLALGATPWAQARQLQLGETPPAELGHDLDGNACKIADGQGQLQMICFWASWCGYCKQLMPILEMIQRKAGAEAMRTLLITSEERDKFRALARHARRELKLQFLHDRSGDLSKRWGGNGYPYLVVVGADGKVRESFSGYSDSLLEPILNEVNGALRERAAAGAQSG